MNDELSAEYKMCIHNQNGARRAKNMAEKIQK
jgi:hypothetical protein